MEFAKLVGSGNDFVVVDNRRGRIRGRRLLARAVCDRKYGVGADGLIMIEESSRANFTMRIFNPDGSEAEMCGNGLRCTVCFLRERGLMRAGRVKLETMAGLYEATVRNARIRTRMSVVGTPCLNLHLRIGRKDLTLHAVDTGVPHAVLLVDDVGKIDVARMGPLIRYHRFFQPRGTNVDWIEMTGRHALKIRTYERGVEAETLSCGTGTVAAAVIAHLLGAATCPVTVTAASQEKLTVQFSQDLSEIFLEGTTSFPFSGTWFGPCK